MANTKSSSQILNLVHQVKRSFVVKDYSYNSKTRVLDVILSSGTIQRFFNVEESIVHDFTNSHDMYEYIENVLRKNFRSEKVMFGLEDEAFNGIIKHLDSGIKKLCSIYYMRGSEKEDVYAIAIETLHKAVQDYSENKNATFEHFALKVCIRKRLITEIYRSKRQKSQPLNEYRSIDTPIFLDKDDSSQTLADLLIDENSDFVDGLINKEEKNYITNMIYGELTQLEAAVLEHKAMDKSYREIAEDLEVSVKCVDNSLGRVKKKIYAIFETSNISEYLK